MVAILGLVYTTIRGGIIGNAISTDQANLKLYEQLDLIQRHIVPQLYEDTEYEDNYARERKANVEAARKPLYFEWGGLAVVSLICVGALFMALF